MYVFVMQSCKLVFFDSENFIRYHQKDRKENVYTKFNMLLGDLYNTKVVATLTEIYKRVLFIWICKGFFLVEHLE